MFGLLLIIAAVVAMVKIADAENQSMILWGVVTLLLVVACSVFIPFPFLGPLAGFILSFGAMTTYKIVTNK